MVVKADKTCPKCQSKDYRFRARRPVPPASETGRPAGTETKYQCATCGHVWAVRVPAGHPAET